MSNLTLRGNPAGTGTFIVESPNSNSNRTLTLPDATTTLVGTDAAQTLTNKTLNGGALALGTAKAFNWNGLTTNTFLDVEGIPSWAKRVTISLEGFSTNGSAQPLFQLGTSGGVQTTGYEGRTVFIQASSVGTSASAAGMTLTALGAAAVRYGPLVLTRFDGGNVWQGSGIIQTSGNAVDMVSGRVSLSGVLDRIRVAAGGADTIDAGSINVMWEG